MIVVDVDMLVFEVDIEVFDWLCGVCMNYV